MSEPNYEDFYPTERPAPKVAAEPEAEDLSVCPECQTPAEECDAIPAPEFCCEECRNAGAVSESPVDGDRHARMVYERYYAVEHKQEK